MSKIRELSQNRLESEYARTERAIVRAEDKIEFHAVRKEDALNELTGQRGRKERLEAELLARGARPCPRCDVFQCDGRHP